MHDLSLSGYSLGIATVAQPYYAKIRPRLTVKRIQEVVADFYGFSPHYMTNRVKEWEFSHPRQVAMLLCRDMLCRSTADIGTRFGGRDHTTILAALKAVKKRAKRNPELREDIAALKDLLRA